MPKTKDQALRDAIAEAGGLIITATALARILRVTPQAVTKQTTKAREGGGWGTMPEPVAWVGKFPIWTRRGAERALLKRDTQTDRT